MGARKRYIAPVLFFAAIFLLWLGLRLFVVGLFPSGAAVSASLDQSLETAFAESGAGMTSVTLRGWARLDGAYHDAASLAEIYQRVKVVLGDDSALFCEPYDDEGFNSVAVRGTAENGAELNLTLQSLAAAETEAGTYLIVETSLPGGKGTAAILNDYAASIFAAAKGRYEPSLLIEGKYEGIRSKKEKRAVAKAVFAAVDGEVTERVSDGSYLSYSGRSRRIDGGVTSGDHTVNLQVALSDNERENATYIYIGSPVVFSDF
ncbi:MAG: YwmB family TATA-box binding protein [Bacillota bacterium]|jgi:hypothetical protein